MTARPTAWLLHFQRQQLRPMWGRTHFNGRVDVCCIWSENAVSMEAESLADNTVTPSRTVYLKSTVAQPVASRGTWWFITFHFTSPCARVPSPQLHTLLLLRVILILPSHLFLGLSYRFSGSNSRHSSSRTCALHAAFISFSINTE